jgi:hypothetical protein
VAAAPSVGHVTAMGKPKGSAPSGTHALSAAASTKLATPYLLPVLEIKLDLESLERADKLTRCPDVVRGIRRFHINVENGPLELSRNEGDYTIYRFPRLDRFREGRQRIMEHSRRQTSRRGGGAIAPQAERCRLSASEAAECRPAFGRGVQIQNASNSSSDSKLSLDPLQEIKQDGSLYQQCELEQRFMVEDGSFVAKASSYMARLGRPISLSFGSKFSYSPLLGEPPRISNANVSMDNDSLSRLSATPDSWNSIDRETGFIVPYKSIRVFSDLPIACHRAGVHVREAFFQCFPPANAGAYLSPGGRDGPREGWGELRAAFQYLEKLDIGRANLGIYAERPLGPAEEADAMGFREYLGAALASPALATVYIKTWSSSCDRVTPALADSLGNRHLKRLHLHEMKMRQSELDAFCQRLPEELEVLELYRIHIWPGDWVDALDVLRAKLAPGRAEGRCEVVMTDLSGGRERPPWFFRRPLYGVDHEGSEVPTGPLLTLAMLNLAMLRYVTGVGSGGNPLRNQWMIRGDVGA